MPRWCSRATSAIAYVFGRDGGLTKVDLLAGRIVKRVMQAGNSIGGAISQDGRLVAVSNYEPGGVRVFDAETLEPVADIPADYGNGTRSKVVGLVDAPGNRFVFSLYDAGEIWIADVRRSGKPVIREIREYRPATLRRADHAGRALLHRRPVRRRRPGAARSVAPGTRRAPHPRRLRPRRGEAAGLQDAAPGRLGARRRPALPAGGRPARSAGGRYRTTGSEVGAHPGARPAGLRHGAPGRSPGLGQLRPSRTTTPCRSSTPSRCRSSRR